MLGPAEQVLRGLWAGALCTVGYLAAPVLFTVLDDRALAGRLAGALFTAATWTSLALAVILCVLWVVRARAGAGGLDRRRLVLALVVTVLLAGNEWGLRPWMEAARLPDGRPGEGFAALHGASSVIWLVASGLALWLAALREGRLSARGG